MSLNNFDDAARKVLLEILNKHHMFPKEFNEIVDVCFSCISGYKCELSNDVFTFKKLTMYSCSASGKRFSVSLVFETELFAYTNALIVDHMIRVTKEAAEDLTQAMSNYEFELDVSRCKMLECFLTPPTYVETIKKTGGRNADYTDTDAQTTAPTQDTAAQF